MRLLGWDKGSTVEVKVGSLLAFSYMHTVFLHCLLNVPLQDGSSKSIDASSKGSKVPFLHLLSFVWLLLHVLRNAN